MPRPAPDPTATPAPVVADGYVRLSDLRMSDLDERGAARGLEDQERRLRELIIRHGWRLGKIIIENDMVDGRPKPASAWKRRTITLPDGTRAKRVIRPGFREALARIMAGAAQALVAVDLDRVARDHRDLEDLIEAVAAREASAVSVSGSLKLTRGGTADERFVARMMVAVGAKASDDTSRRVAWARERQAHDGIWAGGTRPYGFEADGRSRREPECVEIDRWADAVLAGVSLRSIVADLRKRGVPTGSGDGAWFTRTVRDILLRPRNAGHMVYRGEVIGVAPWEPILDDDKWRAVVAHLTDPTRVSRRGPAHRWLGSGIYLCQCGAPLSILISSRKAPSYRCKVGGPGHVARNVEQVDDLVRDVILDLVGRFQNRELLDTGEASEVDINATRLEIRTLRQRKADLAADFADGTIDRAQLAAGTKRLEAKLTALSVRLEAAAVLEPHAALLTAADPLTAWNAMSLGAKRATVRKWARVVVRSAPRGIGRLAEPERYVDITPAQQPRRRRPAQRKAA